MIISQKTRLAGKVFSIPEVLCDTDFLNAVKLEKTHTNLKRISVSRSSSLTGHSKI